MTADEFRASEAERRELADLSDKFEHAATAAAGAGAELDRAVAEGRWTPDSRAMSDEGLPTLSLADVETLRVISKEPPTIGRAVNVLGLLPEIVATFDAMYAVAADLDRCPISGLPSTSCSVHLQCPSHCDLLTEALGLLRLHNRTPSGRWRTCLPACVACEFVERTTDHV